MLNEFLDIAQRLPLVFWAAFGVGLIYFLVLKWDKCRHYRFIWQASNELKRLSKIKEPWKKYDFLREVNPFVFEEMILTAFKRRGWKIKRNKRYTGDGGIDGMVRFKGQWCAIQAKRYKGYINAKDVLELSRICNHRDVKGLFIHTGKTGGKSRHLAERCPRVQIVSGKKMLALFDLGCYR